MTKIILIRHGETLWNAGGRFQGHSDIELSPKGIQQAKLLAKHFPEEKLAAIYASDLKRAVKTAQQVAQKKGLPVLQEPRLREISFGRWEGLTYTEIESRWPDEIAKFYDHPERLCIPGGESFDEAQERSMAAILEICGRHPNQTVAIAAHGGVIRTILVEALHMNLRYVWSIKQENTAINIIRYDGVCRSVELLNSTHHLYSQKRYDED